MPRTQIISQIGFNVTKNRKGSEKGGTLTVTFTNLGAQAYDIRCALRGIKVFNHLETVNQ